MLKFFFLLCCLDALEPYDITKTSRWKTHLPANLNPTIDSRCYISTDISNVALQNKKRACQIFCDDASDTDCAAFIYDAPTCVFMSYLLLPTQPGDSGVAYFSDTSPRDIPVDIARNKTRGYACVKIPEDCWCSGPFMKTLQINLAKTYTIQKIRITPIPTLESAVGAGITKIYVGPSGSALDNIFGTISSDPAPGTTVEVVGSATGKYIFMKKNSNILDLTGLCLCFVEAFGY